MAKVKTVPVSMRALIQRINRKLWPELQQLKATRGDRWRNQLGDYYVVDLNSNAILSQHVSPEKYGRELGCLSPWEGICE